MKKIARYRPGLIAIGFLAAFSATLVSAQAVCPDTPMQGDQDFWAFMGNRGMSYFDIRNWVASFYDLHESDWNGGWGYHKQDEPNAADYAYPKMMNAGMLLLIGLDDRGKGQSDWKVLSEFQRGGIPAVVSRTPDTMDVFVRDPDNKLIHVVYSGTSTAGYWYPWEIGDLPRRRESERVFIVCNCEKEMYLRSDPVAFSRGQENMEVFFRSGWELVRKTWSAGAWSVELPTDDAPRRPSTDPFAPGAPFYIGTKPVVVQRTPDSFNVFAFDPQWGDLIHYYWSAGVGWRAEDVTVRAGTDFRPQGSDPIVVSRNTNILDVFIVDSNGTLFHYFGSPASGWAVEKLGDLLPGSTPAVLSRGSDTLDVFAPGRDFHLRHHYWSPSTGWLTEDLSLQLNGDYFVEGTPAAVLFDQPGGQSIHIFARELGFMQRLYQFSWSAATGWAGADLSGGITTDPVALSRPDRLDVVALNGSGHLIHHYWTRVQAGWLAENVNFGPGVSAVYDTLEGKPLLVSRDSNTVDVVGRKGDWLRLFTSANGNTLTSWHTNQEYSDFAAGSLHQSIYIPGDDESWANAARPIIGTDRVEMCCYSFNGKTQGTEPATRAGTMVHEATHQNFNMSHDSCDGKDCDGWYFHTLRDPLFTLGIGTVPASGSWVAVPNHTPYQLSVEYSCDIGQFASNELPQSAYAHAVALANEFLAQRIKDPPGWKCGDPRPIY
jgi:hypothetical protein